MKKFLSLCLSFTALSFIHHDAVADPHYIRGTIFQMLADPDKTNLVQSYQVIPDGVLIIDNGKITAADSWQHLKDKIPSSAHITVYQDGLIVPGFIDTHIHYPQTDIIAANGGGHLLEWLNTYTFPGEEKFSNPAYAANTAAFFLDQLLNNGTTTALIFATASPTSVDAIFEAAEKRHMRVIAGQMLADQNIPKTLQTAPADAYQESIALIKKWDHKANTRLLYALTPRFAPTTSPALFEAIKKVKQQYPGIYVQTHISENIDEIKWVKKLFHVKNYLDVYDKYDLLGKRTVLAHGIYLTTAELKRIAQTHTHIAFCPTSNLFLGSGLFNIAKVEKYNINFGLGTDIGAGTSFSLLQTLNEAYKVAQLQSQKFSAFEGFYLITLGGAKALDLEDKLGNFQAGKEADFVVLDFKGATPLLKRRLATANSFEDKLFALMMLSDDRSTVATYVDGQLVYQRA